MTMDDQARLIAALEHLKAPFDRKQIGRIPASKGRPALDFVGHAVVTSRLNQYAPDWSYTVDETFNHGEEFWLRGTMTICGVSRVEYGSGPDPLQAVSHFIRRAAMRFGVAVDLWSKEELEASPGPNTRPPSTGQPGGTTSGGTAPASTSRSPEAPSGSEAYGEGASDPANVEGEGGAPVSPSSPSHDPAWIQSPKLRSHEVCETCLGTDSWEHQPRRKKAS